MSGGGFRTTPFKFKNKMKTEAQNIEKQQNPPLLIADVIGRLYSGLIQQLEDLWIEGLKRKGFEFENRTELEAFIKSNCRCEDRMDLKQRTYFVNDIPFFLHYYEIEMDLNQITTDKVVKMSVSYGRYAYL